MTLIQLPQDAPLVTWIISVSFFLNFQKPSCSSIAKESWQGKTQEGGSQAEPSKGASSYQQLQDGWPLGESSRPNLIHSPPEGDDTSLRSGKQRVWILLWGWRRVKIRRDGQFEPLMQKKKASYSSHHLNFIHLLINYQNWNCKKKSKSARRGMF